MGSQFSTTVEAPEFSGRIRTELLPSSDFLSYSVLHFYEKSFLANFAIPRLLRTLDIHAFYILSRVRIIAIGFKVRFEIQNCSKVKVKKYRPWCPGASITLSGIEMLLAFAEG